MKEQALQGSGSPSFCWNCSRQLQRAPGQGKGLFYFMLVRDRDGNTHRVHQQCLADTIGYGIKQVTDAA